MIGLKEITRAGVVIVQNVIQDQSVVTSVINVTPLEEKHLLPIMIKFIIPRWICLNALKKLSVYVKRQVMLYTRKFKGLRPFCFITGMVKYPKLTTKVNI
jgi:hypothetical protein